MPNREHIKFVKSENRRYISQVFTSGEIAKLSVQDKAFIKELELQTFFITPIQRHRVKAIKGLRPNKGKFENLDVESMNDWEKGFVKSVGKQFKRPSKAQDRILRQLRDNYKKDGL